jgi:hypothetical protein
MSRRSSARSISCSGRSIDECSPAVAFLAEKTCTCVYRKPPFDLMTESGLRPMAPSESEVPWTHNRNPSRLPSSITIDSSKPGNALNSGCRCRREVPEAAVGTPRRRGLREVPISRNKTSGHTTWLDVEHLRLPAGLLRSPARVDLGGCHGRCSWLRRSVRSGRGSPDSRSPHVGPIPMHRTKTPPHPSAGRTDAHGRELPVALGQAA